MSNKTVFHTSQFVIATVGDDGWGIKSLPRIFTSYRDALEIAKLWSVKYPTYKFIVLAVSSVVEQELNPVKVSYHFEEN